MQDRYRVVEIGTTTQLLIDDHIVDDIWLLRRIPEMPIKHADNPLPIAPSLYDPDEKLFKTWYEAGEVGRRSRPGCGTTPGVNEALYAHAYTVSEDGFEWHKPSLGIVENAGSKENNLIDTSAMGGMGKGEFEVVMKDAHDPDPRKRYKGVVKRPGRRGVHKGPLPMGGRLFAAHSPDGINWHMYPDERSIIRDSNDGNGCFLYDELIGRYVNFRRTTVLAGPRGESAGALGFPEAGGGEELVRHRQAEDYLHRYLRAVPYVNTEARIGPHIHDGLGCNRRIARTESDDFVNWTEPEVIIRPDELDPPRLYGINVTVCHGVYLGFLQIYNKWGMKGYLGHPEHADTMDLQLTFSRDGWRWERLANRPVFIPRGVIGSWDGGMITNTKVIEYGDEVRIYYGGHSGAHSVTVRSSGTGLATLPKDRFVARAASDELGVLITKPFLLADAALQVNADASHGRIKVEVADPIGTPIPGLTVHDCQPIERDGLRLPVTWANGMTLRDLAGQPVRLRFYLYDAKLYSFTVGGN